MSRKINTCSECGTNLSMDELVINSALQEKYPNLVKTPCTRCANELANNVVHNLIRVSVSVVIRTDPEQTLAEDLEDGLFI